MHFCHQVLIVIDIMKRAYKFKLKPTCKQQQKLLQHFGCSRYIYNWGLDRKKNAYETDKTTLSYIDLAKDLTKLKQQPTHLWLKDVANESLQQSLRCLDSAFANFFKNHKGYPKFKSKRYSTDSCKFVNNICFDFENWKVKVPKIGWVKLCQNKSFDLSKVKIGTLTVSRDRCNEYWCSIVVDNYIPLPPKTKVTEDTTVDIDLGIKDFAALSNGEKIANNKFLEKGQYRLKHLQFYHSRTKKGSKNRERLRYKIAVQHRRITNRRLDFLHKLSTDLIRTYGSICLEDLNVKGMMKNHCLANGISSVAWNEFVRQLSYKSDWYGRNVLFIGRFEPSSKTCNHCGYVNRELTLKDREWTCPQCGEVLDRDVNAALNIKKMGLQQSQVR